ncbi:NACHT domain-containing protein [Candidatus Lokiarchaeum ossiferum]|uniref:NACHT domain-containing protein n=1 Tax=Candidatus Lokiarchaeum ossiferum TaxID=2951803 RepID=UPI00352D501C
MSNISILFLGANYSNSKVVRITQENQIIIDKIQESKFTEKIEYHGMTAVRREKIPKYISTYNPFIIHFAGHGSIETGPLYEFDTPSYLNDPIQDTIDTIPTSIKIVVFNICESEKIVSLLKSKIPIIIGTKTSIDDTPAIEFAGSFYESLANGRSILDSFNFAKRNYDLTTGGSYANPYFLVSRYCEEKLEKMDIHFLLEKLKKKNFLQNEEKLDLKDTESNYFDLIYEKCKYISIEGLPISYDMLSMKIPNNDILVDFQFNLVEENKPTERIDLLKWRNDRILYNQLIDDNSNIFVISPPGGGKSSLIKKSILHFVEEEDLRINSFPVLIICREVKQIGKNFEETVISYLNNMEIGGNTKRYGDLILNVINGKKKLYFFIDGIDEIIKIDDRNIFVEQINEFLKKNDGNRFLITSREPGIRILIKMIMENFTVCKISEMDDNRIKEIIKNWKVYLYGKSPNTFHEIDELYFNIQKNERIRLLAQNPLLLTTLLVIQKWMGQLPSKRSVLYQKTIEILIQTWNISGYPTLELEETIVQLAYVSINMMMIGKRQINYNELRKYLQQARREFPEILSFCNLSITEFINRVEIRSGILRLKGFEIINGQEQKIYEFIHSIFQEYLTAIAFVNGYYRNNSDDENIFPDFELFLSNEDFFEVISLIAVLSGKKCGKIMKEVLEICINMENSREKYYLVHLISQFLVDEVQIHPDLIKKGIQTIIKLSTKVPNVNFIHLDKGKFKALFEEIVINSMENGKDLQMVSTPFSFISLNKIGYHFNNGLSHDIFEKICRLIKNGSNIEKAIGLSAFSGIVEEYNIKFLKRNYDENDENEENDEKWKEWTSFSKELKIMENELVRLLDSKHIIILYPIVDTLFLLWRYKIWKNDVDITSLKSLWILYNRFDIEDLKWRTQQSIGLFPFKNRKIIFFEKDYEKICEFVDQNQSNSPYWFASEVAPAFILAYHTENFNFREQYPHFPDNDDFMKKKNDSNIIMNYEKKLFDRLKKCWKDIINEQDDKS